MRFFMKNKGAVSIFLVLILVPTIACASLFVDASRVKLGQSVLASGCDLTLNTALSQYDADLNDYYGLMASSQSMDEFYKTAADYLTASITSQGVSTTDAQSLINAVAELVGGGSDVQDMLGLKLTGTDSVVSPVKDANLTNPALVKNEIVEFMKYRSPINGSVELFQKFSELGDKLGDSADDSELIDKKQDFYETQGQLTDKALEAYKLILQYKELDLTTSYISSLQTRLSGMEGEYREAHKKMVMDLYNTQGYGVFKIVEIELEPGGTNVYGPEKQASSEAVWELIEDTQTALRDYLKVKKDLVNLMNSINYDSGTYRIQYWAHIMEQLKKNDVYTKYRESAEALIESYELLKNASTNTAASLGAISDTLPSYSSYGVRAAGYDTYYNHIVALSDQIEDIIDELKNDKSDYANLGLRLNGISSDAVNGGKVSTGGVNATVKSIYTDISEFYSTLKKAKELAGKITDKLDELKKLADQYKKDLEKWSDQADRSDTELAQTDREEIEKLQSDIIAKVDSGEVQNLIDRMNNIKSLAGELAKSVEDYKYNGTKALDIDSYNTFRAKSGVSAGKISTVKTELESYAGSSFVFASGSRKPGITNNNNPSLDANPPSFYTWLKDVAFKDYEGSKTDGDIDDGKDKKKEWEDKGDSQAEGADTDGNSKTSNTISGQPDLPSGGATAADDAKLTASVKTIAKFMKGLFSDFGGTMAQAGRDVRDDLYSLDYIMSMFSFDTYELEGKYALARKDGTLDISTVAAAKQAYENQQVKSGWESTEVTDTYNKTLTLNLINAANNYAYGTEVEYIIYGGEKPVKSAYTAVYLIRFATDLTPVFLRYMSPSNLSDPDWLALEALAQGIAAATMGIVPAALTKVVVCLAITAAEAAADLKRLKTGMPVEMFKTQDDLIVSFSNLLADKAEAAAADKNQADYDIPFFYSDYLKLLLFVKLLVPAKADGIYRRTADVIQVNMANQLLKKSGYVLSKSQVYFEIKATAEVKPLMLSLPINSWITGNPASDGKKGWYTVSYSAVRGY